jgi:lipoprotein NlpI
MTAWPAPVIRVFLGQLAPDELLAAADDPNPYKKRGQLCEANFFSGEWSLRQGAKEEAARRFGLAPATVRTTSPNGAPLAPSSKPRARRPDPNGSAGLG